MNFRQFPRLRKDAQGWWDLVCLSHLITAEGPWMCAPPWFSYIGVIWVTGLKHHRTFCSRRMVPGCSDQFLLILECCIPNMLVFLNYRWKRPNIGLPLPSENFSEGFCYFCWGHTGQYYYSVGEQVCNIFLSTFSLSLKEKNLYNVYQDVEFPTIWLLFLICVPVNDSFFQLLLSLILKFWLLGFIFFSALEFTFESFLKIFRLKFFILNKWISFTL